MEGEGCTLQERLRRGRLERVTFLSDAVYAIAITLAAIELRPPPATELGAMLEGLGPQLATYAVSFLVIGVFWWSNRELLTRLTKIDAPLSVLCLVMLCLVAVIPAATRGLYAEPTPAARAFYALSMVAAGTLNCALWLYVAVRPALRHDAVTLRYAWTRVATTATVPLIFASFLVAEGLPGWAAPAAILVVLAIRRVVPRLTGSRR